MMVIVVEGGGERERDHLRLIPGLVAVHVPQRREETAPDFVPDFTCADLIPRHRRTCCPQATSHRVRPSKEGKTSSADRNVHGIPDFFLKSGLTSSPRIPYV